MIFKKFKSTTESVESAIDPNALGLDVVGHSGQWVYVKCPFHDDSTASAEFNILKGLFYCFVCDMSLSAEKLSVETGGSVEKLRSGDVILQIEREEHEWRSLLTAPIAIDNEYLMMRKVTNAQIAQFEIRVANNWIVFPSKNLQGAITGVILRRTDGAQPRYQKIGNVINLWPAESLAFACKNVVVVEGVFGSLRGRQAGFHTFAQLRASPSNDTLRLLNGRSITAFLDDDLPGCMGALKFINMGARVVSPGAEADEISVSSFRRRALSATRKYSHFVKVVRGEGAIRFLRKAGYVKKRRFYDCALTAS